MALDEYQRKRDFTKSPEPAGKKRKRAASAQGQAALLLRAEASGQPSALRLPARAQRRAALVGRAEGAVARSEDQRLAMHVEDHPIEYGTFEGVIPEGYGAGIVMLWDRGTWTPEVDDVDAALKKGDLKFTLDGYKLKGSWVLVRTRGYGRIDAAGRQRQELAAHQAPRRLVGRPRHRRIRAAQREERAGFARDSGGRQARHLAVAQAGGRRRDRCYASRRSSSRPPRSRPDGRTGAKPARREVETPRKRTRPRPRERAEAPGRTRAREEARLRSHHEETDP